MSRGARRRVVGGLRALIGQSAHEGPAVERGIIGGMEPPLMGDHGIVVTDIRHVDIHGSRYLDLVYHLSEDPSATSHVGRIGPEAVEGEARPGGRYVAQFVMRQMTRVRPA